jgi:hypothetical protein
MASVLLITIGSKWIMQIGSSSSTVRTKERWSVAHFLLSTLHTLAINLLGSYSLDHVTDFLQMRLLDTIE